MTLDRPSLFGVTNSNRDFSDKKTWGKNQFNSSFPAALCCYLASQGHDAVYLSITAGKFEATSVPISKVFGIDPTSNELFFAFESQHAPFQKYVVGNLPRTDLVTQSTKTGQCLAGLEIKLTALPDNTTCDLSDDSYGSEIVVRPDTIVYLACSIADSLGEELGSVLEEVHVTSWSDPASVLVVIDQIFGVIERVYRALEGTQKPFLIQPIWKTVGKSPRLADQCLDVFVWSDAGFASFIASIPNRKPDVVRINRQTRTVVWLYRMLLDIKKTGQFDHEKIIDELSYNTRNDKAFASAGNVTNGYMKCARLETPLIRKKDISKIILGGGQNMLSPERRFDAILFNTPELFGK